MNIHKALLEHFIEVMENGKNKMNEGRIHEKRKK